LFKTSGFITRGQKIARRTSAKSGKIDNLEKVSEILKKVVIGKSAEEGNKKEFNVDANLFLL
jgi:hypothetical protein